MGTWGNGIMDNDTSSDIYEDFMDMYNEGKSPDEISKSLIQENEELIDNPDDSNNFWFALALAQWETKSLNPKVFNIVKQIIESENDLAVWKELEADETDLKKRKVILLKFLEKLQSDRQNAKRRVKAKPVVGHFVFPKGTCLSFKLDNGNYGGAIVLETLEDYKYGGQNFIATTRLNQTNKPTSADIENSEVLITNFFETSDPRGEVIWYPSDSYKEYEGLYEVTGYLKIKKKYTYGGVGTRTTAGWDYIKYNVDRQLDFEKINLRPVHSLQTIDFIRDRKWWKFQ